MLDILPPEIIQHILSFACQPILPLRLTCRRLSIVLDGFVVARIMHNYHHRCLLSYLRLPLDAQLGTGYEGMSLHSVRIWNCRTHPFIRMIRSFLSHGCRAVSFFVLVNHHYVCLRPLRTTHMPATYHCSICERKCLCCDTHSIVLYGRLNTPSRCGAFALNGICDACYIALIDTFFVNTREHNTKTCRRWWSFPLYSAETAFNHTLHKFCLRPAFFLEL